MAQYIEPRGQVPSQHIKVPFEDYYAIEQVIIEFCDIFDQHSCGRLSREDFKKYVDTYLSDDVTFQARGLPQKTDRWTFRGRDKVWNKWMKYLFSYQKDAFHLGQPMQMLKYIEKKESLVRLRMVYWYTTLKDNLLKCVSEDIVWGLRYYPDEKLWKITYLENTAALQDVHEFDNLKMFMKSKL
eukprot:105068_1